MKSVNVRDFGALGNGRDDDLAAFQRALLDLQNDPDGAGGELFVPPGRYFMSRTLEIQDMSLVFRGCGREISILIWGNDLSSNGGLYYRVTRGMPTICIQGLSFEAQYSNPAPAIKATWPGGTSMETYFALDDVRIIGQGTTTAWKYGLWLKNAAGVKLHNVYIKGNHDVVDNTCTDPWGCQAAIHFEGDGGGPDDGGRPEEARGNISHMFTNLAIERCNVGIDIDGFYEGIYLTNFEIVFVGIAFKVRTRNTNPNLFVQNGHISFREYGADIKDALNVKFVNVDWYKAGANPNLNGNGVVLERCRNFSLVACKFESVSEDRRPEYPLANENGLYAMQGCDRGVVTGCHFLNFREASVLVDSQSVIITGNHFTLHDTSTALYFERNSSDCWARDNVIRGPGRPIAFRAGTNGTIAQRQDQMIRTR